MCPVCVANATLAAVSAISAGGLSAFAGRKLFLKTERNDQTNETGGEKMKIETMEPKTNTSELNPSKVVSRDEWLIARKDLLTREKELTRLRDEVSRHRRELPWVKIDKDYVFDGPDGKETLADLFDGRSQLIVYHFMRGPGSIFWSALTIFSILCRRGVTRTASTLRWSGSVTTIGTERTNLTKSSEGIERCHA